MATYYIDPWHHWNQTTSSSIINVWNSWQNQYQTTGSSITTNVWTTWNQNATTLYYPTDPRYLPAQPTPEELERRQQVIAENRARAAERSRREQEARDRAKALLLDHLDPVQKRDYEETGRFKVEVGHRTFQINPGKHGNVKELHLQDGREVIIRSFCIPSRRHDVPEPDVHLAQKLMLEGGEDSLREFHRIANITTYRPDLVAA